MTRKQPSTAELKRLASRRMKQILEGARGFPGLKRRLPATTWAVEVSFVGPISMKRLNSRYRGKNYDTDVLSFESPGIFRKEGLLGELVICASVLKRQARQYGHSADTELRILLTHGLLHLLGFDHERGASQARQMLRWEARILGKRTARSALIARTSESPRGRKD